MNPPLPDPLLAHALSYLPLADMVRTRRASRRWKQVVDDTWPVWAGVGGKDGKEVTWGGVIISLREFTDGDGDYMLNFSARLPDPLIISLWPGDLSNRFTEFTVCSRTASTRGALAEWYVGWCQTSGVIYRFDRPIPHTGRMLITALLGSHKLRSFDYYPVAF